MSLLARRVNNAILVTGYIGRRWNLVRRARNKRHSVWVFFVMLLLLSLLLVFRLGVFRGKSGAIDPDTLENCEISTGAQTMVSALRDTEIERVFGETRTATAAEISRRCFERAENVLLTSGDNYADALAGVPLAYALDAPILLVQRSQPDSSTMYMMERLGAKNIYILGGERAISAECAVRFSDKGFNVKRIYGADRYETAVRIAEELEKVRGDDRTEVFFASAENYPDALAASAPAALKGAPILYISSDGQLDNATRGYLRSADITGVKILGGTGAIGRDAETSISSVTHTAAVRIWGSDRYETNLKINEWYASLLNGKVMCVATGRNYPDALAGGVLAARERAPMLLVDGASGELIDAQEAFIRKTAPTHIYILGGVSAVPESIADSLRYKDESERKWYLSVRASSAEEGGTYLLYADYDKLRRGRVDMDECEVCFTEHRLPVYDSFSDMVFYIESSPDEEGLTDESLIMYDRKNDRAEMLAGGFSSVKEVIPTDNAVYMLAVMKGAGHTTPVKLDRGTNELTVFDRTGKWDFGLLEYDSFGDRLLGTAALTEEIRAARSEAEEKKTAYVPPNHALFVFNDDFTAPGIIFRTENMQFRRIAAMPDGRVYMTLEDGRSYKSRALDVLTGELSDAAELDDLMNVTQSVCFSPDGKRIFFVGSKEGGVRALYSCEPDKGRITQHMMSEDRVIDSVSSSGK